MFAILETDYVKENKTFKEFLLILMHWQDFEEAHKTSISSNKRRASNKRRPLKSAAPLGIHIEISASL